MTSSEYPLAMGREIVSKNHQTTDGNGKIESKPYCLIGPPLLSPGLGDLTVWRTLKARPQMHE